MRPGAWLWLINTVWAIDSVLVGKPLIVHQTEKWNYYLLPINSTTTYVSAVLKVESANSQVAFALRDADYPVWRNGKFTADLVDIPGWQYNSSQHSITLRANSFPPNANLYVGVYLFSQDNFTDATYTLEAYASTDCSYLCRIDGKCIGGKCQCASGFVGVDCRFPAKELTDGSPSDFAVPTANWVLFSLNSAGAGDQ